MTRAAVLARIKDLCDQASEKRRQAARHVNQFDRLSAEAEALHLEAAELARTILPPELAEHVGSEDAGIVPKGDGW